MNLKRKSNVSQFLNDKISNEELMQNNYLIFQRYYLISTFVHDIFAQTIFHVPFFHFAIENCVNVRTGFDSISELKRTLHWLIF